MLKSYSRRPLKSKPFLHDAVLNHCRLWLSRGGSGSILRLFEKQFQVLGGEVSIPLLATSAAAVRRVVTRHFLLLSFRRSIVHSRIH